jgi:PAS domain S-box-containing protein
VISSNEALKGSYDPGLVMLSVLIGMFASYTALNLATHHISARRSGRSAWLAGGCVVMGIGIWSMHFTGMLAFSLPVPVGYHWPTVLLAFFVAVFSSAVALYVITWEKISGGKVAIGSVIMGLSIAGLHYTAMDSMRLAGGCRYNLGLVTLSVVLAIVISLPPMWFVFHFRQRTMGTILERIASSIGLGAAISVMHYTGMASESFFASTVRADWSHVVSVSSLGAAGIATVTLVVQAVGSWMSFVEQRLAVQALETLERDRFRQIADNLHEVLVLANADCSEMLYVNRTYQQIWGREAESLYANPKSWLEGVHPDDRAHIEDAVQRLLGGEPLDGIECRVIRPNGSISWIVTRGYPVRDSAGHIYRLVGSAQEITERKQAKYELQELSRRLLTLQDEERRSIARNLHDSTAQDLVALATTLSQLHDAPRLSRSTWRKLISECQAVADRSIREIRTLSYLLYPPMLEKTGLEDAIRDYVEGFTKRSGIPVDLELSPHLGRMTREAELALFRVVQESLTNIQRHSGSPQAKIRIDRSPERVTLEVIDKGHGIPGTGRQESETLPLGVGIPSMRERVKQIGGRLEIESTSHGTTVRVIIPIHDEKC